MDAQTHIRLCTVIPTYNNATTICDVVARVYAQMQTLVPPTIAPTIIVVADGPTDDTLLRLQAQSVPLTIVHYAKNRGKGYALRQDFEKARELGFTHVLTIDSDGQHYPEDIPVLYRAFTLHPESIIIGSRGLKQDNMPQKNTFANKFSNFWFALQTGTYLPDTQTGFRIYPLQRLHGERLMTSRYEAELELLVFSAWAEVDIISVPIRVYYPPKEERISHFRPAYDFTRISLLNTCLCVLALVYGLPRRWLRSILYWPVFFFYLLCCLYPVMGLMLLRYGNTPQMRSHLQQYMKKSAKRLLWLIPGVRCRVAYEDNATPINEAQPAMLIANHYSLLDIILLMSLHGNAAFVAQGWVPHNPLFGRIARRLGIIPADAGMENILQQAKENVEEGCSLVIFPEGTRSKTGDLGRFHRGAFYIAEQLHLPIRPIVIRGTYEVHRKTEIQRVGRVDCIVAHVMPEISAADPSWGTNYQERTRRFAAYYRQLTDCEAFPFLTTK